MGWYRRDGRLYRTSSSKPTFKSTHFVYQISPKRIDDEYQKCLQSAGNTFVSPAIVDGIKVNQGDDFTYTAEFSFFQRLFACDMYFTPKKISIYRNGVYDHDIVPTQIANVAVYYRGGYIKEAYNYCKKLNKAAGHAVDTHSYDIKRCGTYYIVKVNYVWADEYKYESLTDCLKHIVVNSNAYSDTELGYELRYLNSSDCVINSVTIKNKAELKRYIQGDIRLPYQI